MSLKSVLVIVDDLELCRSLQGQIEAHGVSCQFATSKKDALSFLEMQKFDAVVLSYKLGNQDEFSMIPMIHEMQPSFTKVIMLNSLASIPTSVGTMEKGNSTFVVETCDAEKVASEIISKISENTIKTVMVDNHLANQLGIIGSSKRIAKTIKYIEQIKDIDSSVLILGESGTGKELVARAIHQMSKRSKSPYEALNCGAIPEPLLESELFGYRKGAFTDAKHDHVGLFEICHNGTLFLDEIGELSLALQVKLLRVIQEKEFKPIGSTKSVKVNTKIICATNRNLQLEVKKGNFREDLYFRLSVFPVYLPPLRERREDIPALVEFFLNKFNLMYQRSVAKPSTPIMGKLIQMNWPGNIRELQNSIERVVVLSTDNLFHLKNMMIDQPVYLLEDVEEDFSPNSKTYAEAKMKFEKNYVIKLLKDSDGNITKAAKISGRFRSDLYRLIEKYQINQSEFRD